MAVTIDEINQFVESTPPADFTMVTIGPNKLNTDCYIEKA